MKPLPEVSINMEETTTKAAAAATTETSSTETAPDCTSTKNATASTSTATTTRPSETSPSTSLTTTKTTTATTTGCESTATSASSSSAKSDSKLELVKQYLNQKIVPTIEQKLSFDSEEQLETKHLRTRTALTLLLIIFGVSLTALLFVYCTFPNLEEHEKVYVKFPQDIDDAKNLGLVLSRYKDKYYYEVLGGVFVTYLFLQTFAIPGSIFLSIVSGYLFDFPVALTLICFCSATGASFCYLLSYLVGRRLVYKYLPERAADWSTKVAKHKKNIMSYIIFLRITPFLPNWFINIVSPLINVHLKPFWIGTFIGVAPPSFVAIQAGTTLQQLTSTTEALTFQSVALLVIFAFLSLLPVFLKNRKILLSYYKEGDIKEMDVKAPAAAITTTTTAAATTTTTSTNSKSSKNEKVSETPSQTTTSTTTKQDQN